MGIGGYAWLKRTPRHDAPVSGSIVLAVYKGDSALIPYLALELGYFQDHGLDVALKPFEAGKLAVDELVAGRADMATAAESVLVCNGFQHPDLRLISTLAIDRINGLVARKDRGIVSARDLKGKTIGVTLKSSGEFNLGMMLMFSGLSIKDIRIQDLNPGEIVDSVVSGRIDAGFSWDPNLYRVRRALKENAVVIKTDVPEVRFVLMGRQAWLNRNPDLAVRFLKSLVQAETYIQQHPEIAKRFAQKRFGYEQDYLDDTWADHQFILELPQPLLVKMEDQARWYMARNNMDEKEMPNYMDLVYFEALNRVKPESISMIRPPHDN